MYVLVFLMSDGLLAQQQDFETLSAAVNRNGFFFFYGGSLTAARCAVGMTNAFKVEKHQSSGLFNVRLGCRRSNR